MTQQEIKEFIEWHEAIIAKYNEELKFEFRAVRTKWLGGWI